MECQQRQSGLCQETEQTAGRITAAVTVNGQHDFGTDFSGRPNYIATMEGKKFFFPKKAYKLYANAFQAFF
jgi:hypothetical protein